MINQLQELDLRALLAGVSLSAVADRAKVSSATIARWRAGADVRLRTLNKMQVAMDAIEAEKAR